MFTGLSLVDYDPVTKATAMPQTAEAQSLEDKH